MKKPPNIQAARVIESGLIELVWSTGETLNVNLADLPKRNAAFAKLADPIFFAKLERDDWGHGIGWPGGLDLGADRLYELSREQAGLSTASEFGNENSEDARMLKELLDTAEDLNSHGIMSKTDMARVRVLCDAPKD